MLFLRVSTTQDFFRSRADAAHFGGASKLYPVVAQPTLATVLFGAQGHDRANVKREGRLDVPSFSLKCGMLESACTKARRAGNQVRRIEG